MRGLSSKTLCLALLLRFRASTVARVSRRGLEALQAASDPSPCIPMEFPERPCQGVLDYPVDRLESGWRHTLPP